MNSAFKKEVILLVIFLLALPIVFSLDRFVFHNTKTSVIEEIKIASVIMV